MNTPTQFTQAITALGKNDDERAKALGVSRVTVIQWRSGNLPRSLKVVFAKPELAAALAADAANADQQAA